MSLCLRGIFLNLQEKNKEATGESCLFIGRNCFFDEIIIMFCQKKGVDLAKIIFYKIYLFKVFVK